MPDRSPERSGIPPNPPIQTVPGSDPAYSPSPPQQTVGPLILDTSSSSRAWALVTGTSSTISMTLAEVSSISLRNSVFLFFIIFRKVTMVIAATGGGQQEKYKYRGRLLLIVTTSATPIFRAIFKMLKNNCVERPSTASTSRMILDCSRPDWVST